MRNRKAKKTTTSQSYVYLYCCVPHCLSTSKTCRRAQRFSVCPSFHFFFFKQLSLVGEKKKACFIKIRCDEGRLFKVMQMSQLVSWCFEPSQRQRITSGLNTNFILSQSYSFHKSSCHKSCFFSLFIFRGHSTRQPASSRVTYLILRAYTGTGVSHSQRWKKIGREFAKNADEWTGRLSLIHI